MIMVTLSLSTLNQMEFHSVQKLKGKLSPRSYPIQLERKWKYSFLSVSIKNDTFTRRNAILVILSISTTYSNAESVGAFTTYHRRKIVNSLSIEIIDRNVK